MVLAASGEVPEHSSAKLMEAVMTPFVAQVLIAAGIKHQPFVMERNGMVVARPLGVVVTRANQLLGSYADLKRFQRADSAGEYCGWQAHHIVEEQDLSRPGVAHLFPTRDGQLCVLLPERAHIGRTNSILRHQNPIGIRANVAELRGAYRLAYAMIGDYCGGGEAAICMELMAIVDTIFRLA
jgi:hypothetical protein